MDNLKKIKLNKIMAILFILIIYFILLGTVTRLAGWIAVLGSIVFAIYLFTGSEKFKNRTAIVKTISVIGLLFIFLFGVSATQVTQEYINQNKVAAEKAQIDQQKAEEAKNEKQAKAEKEEKEKKEAAKKVEEEAKKQEELKKQKEEQDRLAAEQKAKEEEAKKQEEAKQQELAKQQEETKKQAETSQAQKGVDQIDQQTAEKIRETVANSQSLSSASASNSAPASQNNGRIVYYVPKGKSYHYRSDCPTLARSKTILSGSLQDVINMGKSDPCDVCVR